MAQLKAPTGGTGLQITELPPPGQYVAVCVRVNDLFDVERQKFQSQEMELRDVTRFVFGLKDQAGKMYLIQTYEYTISGAPGSNLIKFLKAWLGTDPQMGWDYAEQRGKGAMITVQHKPSAKNAGQFYANITGIAPVFAQLQHLVPNAAEFEPMIAALEQQSAQRQQQNANPAPRPPGAGYPQPGYPNTPPPAPGYGHPPATPPGYAPAGALVPPPPPAPVAPPPPPPAPAAPQLSPDGKWQLVNNQWVPYAPTPAAPPPPPAGAPVPPPAPGGYGNFTPPPTNNLDEDVPF